MLPGVRRHVHEPHRSEDDVRLAASGNWLRVLRSTLQASPKRINTAATRSSAVSRSPSTSAPDTSPNTGASSANGATAPGEYRPRRKPHAEREVGVALLEREGRGVRLTDAARTLVRHTETVLAQLEAAEADLAGQAGAVAGRLRVAAFQTAAKTFVAAMVAELRRDHPALELAVDDLEPADSLSALRLSELDVAVVHEYPFAPRARHPGLVFTDLMDDPLHVAVPSGDPARRALGDPPVRPRGGDVDRRPRGHRLP
jgi:hypothetical protein